MGEKAVLKLEIYQVVRPVSSSFHCGRTRDRLIQSSRGGFLFNDRRDEPLEKAKKGIMRSLSVISRKSAVYTRIVYRRWGKNRNTVISQRITRINTLVDHRLRDSNRDARGWCIDKHARIQLTRQLFFFFYFQLRLRGATSRGKIAARKCL